MTPTHVRWERFVPAPLTDEGRRLLAATGFSEDGFRKRLKERVFDAITLSHWRGLVRSAGRMAGELRANGSLPEQVIAERLGQDKSTSSKWVHGHQLPAGDKVLAAATLVLKRDMDQVGFPPRREVLWETALRLLTLVRSSDLGREPRPLTRGQFAAVWWLSRHPEAERYRAVVDVTVTNKVHDDVFKQLRALGHEPGSSRVVVDAVVDWWDAYLMFRTGLSLWWEAVDGVAAE